MAAGGAIDEGFTARFTTRSDSSVGISISSPNTACTNVIGKEQLDTAFTFFKSLERDGDSIGGQAFVAGPETGCALLTDSPAWWECKVVGQLDQGDHTLFLGEVLEAGTRAEDQTILMRDHNLNYGG